MAYDAVMILMAAIERCCCFVRDEILAALSTMDPFEGVSGAIRFDENGDQHSVSSAIQRDRPGYCEIFNTMIFSMHFKV